VKPVSVKYSEAEEQLDMKLAYVHDMVSEVRGRRMGSEVRRQHAGESATAGHDT
jgi:hypothetical protein